MGGDVSTDEMNAMLQPGYNSPEHTELRADSMAPTAEFQIGNLVAA
jgi:hypothetical protein